MGEVGVSALLSLSGIGRGVGWAVIRGWALINFFFLPLFHQCDRCLEWGLMAGLRGFASHRGSFLSRGWLATMAAPGYPRHPPST